MWGLSGPSLIAFGIMTIFLYHGLGMFRLPDSLKIPCARFGNVQITIPWKYPAPLSLTTKHNNYKKNISTACIKNRTFYFSQKSPKSLNSADPQIILNTMEGKKRSITSTCPVRNISPTPYLVLTLLLLNTTCPVLANSVDPDQLASEEANWSGSALFATQ